MTLPETAASASRRGQHGHSRENHLQSLWGLRQSIEMQARGTLCADNTANGRLIAKALRRQVQALDFAIDELDHDSTVRRESDAAA